MAEIADIVTKLWERTNEHKIPWEPTVNETAFLASIGDSSSVTITSYRRQIGGEHLRFQIMDERGRELGKYETYGGGDAETNEKLIDIYTEARRTALKIDSHFDDILQELEKE